VVPRLTECCFFQRFPGRLREKEIDKKYFERQKATVRDKVPPADIFKANRINKSGEKLGTAREQLKDRDAMRTLSVRPELNEKCYRLLLALVEGQVDWDEEFRTISDSIERQAVARSIGVE
jgi:hypothetical protein